MANENNEYVERAIDTATFDGDDAQMSLSEFVDELLENPEFAASASEYLLSAIEHFGTRTVVEKGEEKERWEFFDDPANDGEHAILGHTEKLNSFVEDLRQQAKGTANEEKIFWFSGPTATGKSEIKRCLIHGLKAYSRTDEGKRYTIEWNAETTDGDGPRYIDGEEEPGDGQWFQSPVQANPVTVLPDDVREDLLHDAGVTNAHEVADVDLDPFSEEAVEIIKQRHGHTGSYEQAISDDHLRVVRYEVDHGTGIGVLQSEDGGTPKHKMAGEWMPGMIKELDSRGRRNPHAFAYDGVFSQGNSGLAVVEEASHHMKMLSKLLNVVDDNIVKIDRRNAMPLDTVMVLLSNPDLEEELSGSRRSDESKALRRRMVQYNMPYLITYSDEAELLYRLLTGKTDLWLEDGRERMKEGVTVDGTELAPRTLEVAAFYEVLTRLSEKPGPKNALDMSELVELYEFGEVEIEDQDDPVTIDDEIDQNSMHENDGMQGMPCTYTRDVLADLIAEQDVIIPQDAIETMMENVDNTAVFSGGSDKNTMKQLEEQARDYAFDRQELDVLDAIMGDDTVSESEIETYVEHVYCWGTDDETVEPDPLKMKVFEIENLQFSEGDYNGTDPKPAVREFREEDIIQGISKYMYENRDEDFEVSTDDVPVTEFDVLKDLVEENRWSDVLRKYENFDPSQWDNPLSDTQTEEVKNKAIDNMVSEMGYSEESAKRVSSIILDQVEKDWDIVERVVEEEQ